jgi:hypothetical protein
LCTISEKEGKTIQVKPKKVCRCPDNCEIMTPILFLFRNSYEHKHKYKLLYPAKVDICFFYSFKKN